jgi:probable F420-dependent oxidoreductase
MAAIIRRRPLRINQSVGGLDAEIRVLSGAMAAVGQIGISLPVQEELTAPQYVELARAADQEGLHTVFVGEIAGIECFAALGMLASATVSIRLASGVVSIYTRSPVLTAMGFATVASLAPGRVAAGLGTGSHVVVRDWHGGQLTRPRTRMREFIAAFREALSGRRVSRVGETLSVSDYQLRIPRQGGDIPVLMGSFNSRMLRLAGAVADGVILSFCPLEELAGRVAEVHAGAIEAGRDPGELEIALYMSAYAGTELDAAIERFRRLVLQYAVQPTHRAGFAQSIPELDRATALWQRGERRQALALVPEEAVLRLCPIGSADDVLGRVEATRAAGVTLPVLAPQSLIPGDALTPMATIRAVAAAQRAPGRAT